MSNIEPYTAHECAGAWVEIVPDTDGSFDPQDNDNAGTIYSWVYDRTWEGDERISEPDFETCPNCGGPEGYPSDHAVGCPLQGETIDLALYMRWNYDAVLTIPLFFADYGSSGARLYVSDDDPNCAICFTQKELDEEWHGSVDDATKYTEARIDELDQWLQGNVWGIVVYDREGGEVMESCWGFIGEPDADYIKDEASAMAKEVAKQIAHERELAQEWAARGVMTITN